MRDEDVPAFWQQLGLPGLIDIHVHFMPDRLMDAVWRYFDGAAAHFGTAWPVHYRTSAAERVATLHEIGVRHFTSLLYPHKPGMAESLNAWARVFAARTPGCVRSATFFAEPSAAAYVRDAVEDGARVFKAHVQVGGYDPRDETLQPVWGLLAEAGVPVVVHCGNGPERGRHTGADTFAQVLAAHPRLTAVIAHAGAPEYLEHIELAERYPNVHLDTTMVGTAFLGRTAPIPADAIRRLGNLANRVVLGSDFPNIPYPFAEQVVALEGFGLGDDWLRAVCWHNSAKLLRV
jgi:hypothetical protein